MSQAPKENEKRIVLGYSSGGDIVARGGSYYRNARFIIVAMFLGWGLWSIQDGFYKYPRERDAARQKYIDQARQDLKREPTKAEIEKLLEGSTIPHEGNYDILFNVVLGILLPPASLLVLAWTLYNSRGAYRLSGDTLHIPGHPPIPLDAIRKIDNTRWDRKGIALLEYELPGAKPGVAKIDDFVYDQKPTDAIKDRIEAYVAKRLGDGVEEIADTSPDTKA